MSDRKDNTEEPVGDADDKAVIATEGDAVTDTTEGDATVAATDDQDVPTSGVADAPAINGDDGPNDPDDLFQQWCAEADEANGSDADATVGDAEPTEGKDAKDGKGKDDGEKRTPWQAQKRPENRYGYTRPPEPDKPLQPHSNHPKVTFYGKRVPRVLITPDAYKRMCLYVEIASKEVGWLGTVTMTRNGDFLIEKTFLLEQEVTATETELSTADQEKLVLELLEKGDEGFEESNRLRFWGHSHVRMGIQPSSTDESTMDRFFEEGYPWYLRGIFNKKGAASFSIFNYEQGMRIDDLPWFVVDPADGRTLLQYNKPKPWAKRWRKIPKPQPLPGQDPLAYQDLWSWRSTGGMELVDPEETTKIPDELVIDDELRAEVQAEFDAKVTERSLWRGGGGNIWDAIFGTDSDKDDDTTDDGDKSTEAAAKDDGADESGTVEEDDDNPLSLSDKSKRRRRRRKPAKTAENKDEGAPPEDTC